jgi:lipopolysaccharide/colanic/teichoic acid biosynthesis glycosyltransferase
MSKIDKYSNIKRLLDLVISYLLWIIFSPLLWMVFLAVKLTSPGPGFYKWQVVGEKGRYFLGFKFRSMYQNADEIKAKLINSNEMTGPVFKMTNDPRVTPLGRILRKFSIDELPQLYNVINGDMSLVGPRPPLQSEYEHFTEWQKQKLAVKPGLTCLWQILGRNDVADFNEWVKLDLEYIENRSLGLDRKILFDTIKCVIRGTGK